MDNPRGKGSQGRLATEGDGQAEIPHQADQRGIEIEDDRHRLGTEIGELPKIRKAQSLDYGDLGTNPKESESFPGREGRPEHIRRRGVDHSIDDKGIEGVEQATLDQD